MHIRAWEQKYRRAPNHQHFDAHTRKRLDEFASLLPTGARILDAGCGDGRKAAYLAGHGFKVVGVDPSPTAIAHAEKLSKLEFRLGSVTKLPFHSRTFDAILAFAVYHCLSAAERKRFAKEARRVLKDRGVLYLLTLSSRDGTVNRTTTAENRTYRQSSGITLHLSTEAELRADFKDFRSLRLMHTQRELRGRNNAIFVAVLRKR